MDNHTFLYWKDLTFKISAYTGILSLLARPYYKYPGLFVMIIHKLHCDIITFAVIVRLQSHVTKVFSWRHSCFRLTSLVIVVTRCHYYFCNFFFFLLASSFFFCHISHSDGIMYQRNHITHTLLMLHGGGMIFSWKILGKLFDGRIIKLQAETCCSLGLLSSISKNTQYWIILAIIFQTLHFIPLLRFAGCVPHALVAKEIPTFF